MIDLDKLGGFEWGEGNIHKSWKAHGVTNSEAEETFFNKPVFTSEDIQHSTEQEKRFFSLGKTNKDRNLYVVFTIRNNLIRIISAKDMSKKERKTYNEKTKENT